MILAQPARTQGGVVSRELTMDLMFPVGTVVIVTGGGHGIGRVYCRAFAAAGARVVIAERDAASASRVADEINASGGQALAVPTDVADEASVSAMVRATIAAFGGVDVLVNNAAVFATDPLTRADIEDLPVEEWDRTMAVNLRGPFLCTRAVVPVMKQRGGGRIINVSSGTAFHGGGGWPQYITSKAGLLGLTRSAARELGPYGITVNAIAPGNTPTEATSAEDLERQKATVAARAIPRVQTPEDLVGTVLFLASPAAAFITGQTIVVDGGRVLH